MECCTNVGELTPRCVVNSMPVHGTTESSPWGIKLHPSYWYNNFAKTILCHTMIILAQRCSREPAYHKLSDRLNPPIATGGNLPKNWFSPHSTKTASNCLERFRYFFQKYIGREPQNFPISAIVPKFWWETKATTDREKLVSIVTRVRRVADEKN